MSTACIFGVGAVVAMLAITAGVEKEMLSYIDLLGVNNIIVEAREASNEEELTQRRKVSQGLSFKDVRALRDNLPLAIAKEALEGRL